MIIILQLLSSCPKSNSFSVKPTSNLSLNTRRNINDHCRDEFFRKFRPNINSSILHASLSNDEPPISSQKSKIHKDDNDNIWYWKAPVSAIALPALIGMMADPLLSFIDTIFVGKLANSSIELASLGACTSIFHLAFHTFKASTSVTTSLVSSAIAEEGNEQSEAAKEITLTSLLFAVICGICVSVFLTLFANPALASMGVSQYSESKALYRSAMTYLRIRLSAAPAVLLITVCEGAFRGRADTRTPLLASSLAAICNLILDPLLMFGPTIFDKALRFGIGGAAAATAASQYVAAALYLYFIKRRNMLPNMSKFRRNIKKNLGVAKDIALANLYMLSRQWSLLLLWAYATARATRIGYAHVAAHQISLSYWLLFALVLDGPGVAAQVITNRILYSDDLDSDMKEITPKIASQKVPSAVKKGDKSQSVKSFLKYVMALSTCLGIATTGFIILIPLLFPQFYTTFTSDMIVIGLLRKVIPIVGLQLILVGFCLTIEGVVSGARKFLSLSMFTNISAIISAYFVRKAMDVSSIWSRGINSFFALRFITGLLIVRSIVKENKGANKGEVK